MNIQDLLKEGNYTLIDVREPMELEMDGKFDDAINIPTSQFEERWEEIKEINGPKIIFCKSGGRSAGVVEFLLDQKIDEVYNGGGYMMLNYMMQN